MMSYNDKQLAWFRALKRGDKVALEHGDRWQGYRSYYIYEVVNITPTQKVFRRNDSEIGELRARFKDGHILGGQHNFDRFEEITDEVKEAMRYAKLFCRARDIINHFDRNLRGTPVAALEKIVELEEFMPDNRPKPEKPAATAATRLSELDLVLRKAPPRTHEQDCADAEAGAGGWPQTSDPTVSG